ncbi:MAG: hypothetical protein OXG60_14405 [Chloroflexi bacterium]|nr:hypothetical protein [Chloroflexota bacterium]
MREAGQVQHHSELDQDVVAAVMMGVTLGMMVVVMIVPVTIVIMFM